MTELKRRQVCCSDERIASILVVKRTSRGVRYDSAIVPPLEPRPESHVSGRHLEMWSAVAEVQMLLA